MPYPDSSIPLYQLHTQAPIDPTPPPTFTHAVFIGMVDGIRMAKNGAAIVTITVEPDHVAEVFPLWQANSIINVSVTPWEPVFDDD